MTDYLGFTIEPLRDRFVITRNGVRLFPAWNFHNVESAKRFLNSWHTAPPFISD